MYPVIALAVVLIAWSAISGRAARYSVTIPIALLAAGALLAGGGRAPGLAEVSSSAMRHLVEATLALILFTEATEISLRGLRAAGPLPVRLLLIGFPLTVVAGFAAGLVLFPDANVWLIGLVAAALAATDGSLAAALVRDERLPHDLRTAVQAESGFNDGLAAPLVLFFAAAAVAVDHERQVGSVLGHTVAGLAIALAVGVAAGWISGRLLRMARERGWSDERAERLAYPAIAALAVGGAHVLHGNAIVAAFVAGLAVRAADRDLPPVHLRLSEDLVALLSAVVWFVFGALLPGVFEAGITWAMVAYAVLSLTLVRMIPVEISLLGLHRPWRDRLLLGWLGPSGLPSVIFALIAIDRLTGASERMVARVIAVAVLLSVLAHGLSSIPIARRWSPP